MLILKWNKTTRSCMSWNAINLLWYRIVTDILYNSICFIFFYRVTKTISFHCLSFYSSCRCISCLIGESVRFWACCYMAIVVVAAAVVVAALFCVTLPSNAVTLISCPVVSRIRNTIITTITTIIATNSYDDGSSNNNNNKTKKHQQLFLIIVETK